MCHSCKGKCRRVSGLANWQILYLDINIIHVWLTLEVPFVTVIQLEVALLYFTIYFSTYLFPTFPDPFVTIALTVKGCSKSTLNTKVWYRYIEIINFSFSFFRIIHFVLFMHIPIIFSSNVQVTFSDYLLSVSRLSVRMFVNFSHFYLSRTIRPNFTKL